MADFQDDLTLNRAAQAELKVKLDRELAPTTTGVDLEELNEQTVDNHVPFYQSFGEAFVDTEILATGIRAANNVPVAPKRDPDLDIEVFFKKNPDRLADFQPFFDDIDGPAAGSILSELHDAVNEDQIVQLSDQIRASRERMRVAGANSGWSLAGTLSGIGVDIAASLFLTGGTATAATTARGARLLQIAKFSALGTAEGGGFTALASVSDPMITSEDILRNAGLGGGLGAALGLVLPTNFGRLLKAREALEPQPLDDVVVAEAKATRQPARPGDSGAGPDIGTRALAEAAEEERAATAILQRKLRESTAGAAAVPGTVREIIEPATRAGTVVAGKLPGVGPTILRNPKRVIVDMGVRGAKAFAATGAVGARKFYDHMSRTLHFSTVNQSEVGGAAARADTVDKFIGELKTNRVTRETVVKREYSAMMTDVFGQDNLPIGKFVNEKVGRMQVTAEEFEALADEVSIAAGADRKWDLPQEYAAKMTPDQQEKFMGHLRSTAAKEDAYYQEIGKLEVEMGVIKAEELIPGYRPQRWNKDEIAAASPEFDHFLRTAFSKNPSDEWVRTNWLIRTADGGEESVLKADETFADLVRRDPELADEIVDEWSVGVRREAEDKAFVAMERLKAEEAAIRKGTSDDIEARMLNTQNKAAKFAERLQRRLDKLTDSPEDLVTRERLATQLGRAEKRYYDIEVRLDSLRRARQNVDDLNAFIRKFGNAGQTRKLGVASRRANVAARKEAAVAARKLVGEEIADIRQAILGGKNPFGHVDQDFINTSSRFKRRTINLGAMRHTEQARRFLLTNSHDARTSFGASVDPQLGIKQAFGTEATAKNLRGEALAGFDEDLQKFPGDKAILKEKELAEKLYDRIYDEITHADVTGLNQLQKNIADLGTIANTATAAMSLGGVLLAQVGDLALLAVAGGRLGTGFKGMMRPAKTRKILEEVFQNDAEIAVLLKGPSVVDSSRFKSLFELDQAGFDVAGGRMRKVMRGTDKVAVIEGWANFMHSWNHWVRGSFGLDFARQIGDDFGNYANLKPVMKSFYAKHGVDGEVAARIKRLLDEDGIEVAEGHLRIPDQAAWSVKDPGALAKYRMLLKSAGDEAMIDPQVADRPFLRSFPGGRMVLQFQSFMFTAGERFVAPMVQEAFLHPTSIRPYVGALLGVLAGMMSDGLKEAARGEGDEWLDRWGDDEGFRDNMYGAVLRSPMMGGMSSMLTDLAMTTLGENVNDGLEAIGLPRASKEATTRFQANQGLYSLMGPTSGFLLGTAPSIVKKYAAGDVEEATQQVSRRLPIMNTFYLQSLGRYMDLLPKP